MIKAVIVEDEASSRETLFNYLGQYCPDVNVVGVYSNIIEGKVGIEQHDPELVFLDIEMPFGNGFDLLDSIPEIHFETIFVTAYSHYALRAIQHSASNYILKPIDNDELVKAVDKIKNKKSNQPNSTRILLDNIRAPQKQNTKIILPILEGLEVVLAGEIIHCDANDNYTRFFMEDGRSMLICRTLKYYQEILSDLDFLRIHKSHIVNLDKIKKYIKGKGGFVSMSNGNELPVSQSKKAELVAHLGR